MTKNNHGQPVTETNHVLKATEVHYAVLDDLYGRKLTRKELMAISEYITDIEHNASMNHHRQGLRVGRLEGLTMAETALSEQHDKLTAALSKEAQT
jgi:hypothetical protein